MGDGKYVYRLYMFGYNGSEKMMLFRTKAEAEKAAKRLNAMQTYGVEFYVAECSPERLYTAAEAVECAIKYGLVKDIAGTQNA